MSAAEALEEMMSNWTKVEAEVKANFPSANDEEIYQMTAAAMNGSLSL